MKRADVELRLPERARHPIHRLIDESDAVARDVLVQGSVLDADRDTFLFYGEGDPETYADALDAVDRVVSFDVTRVDENGFYAFLTQRRDAVDEATFRSLERPGLLVLPPVEFLPEGRARLTLVGRGELLGDTLGALPEWLDHEVRRVGPYRRGDALFDPGLTDRQFEAVAAAVDVGYYDGPGAPGVDAVADALGCAESTAAEHLRKAERTAMTALVDLRRPP